MGRKAEGCTQAGAAGILNTWKFQLIGKIETDGIGFLLPNFERRIAEENPGAFHVDVER